MSDTRKVMIHIEETKFRGNEYIVEIPVDITKEEMRSVYKALYADPEFLALEWEDGESNSDGPHDFNYPRQPSMKFTRVNGQIKGVSNV